MICRWCGRPLIIGPKSHNPYCPGPPKRTALGLGLCDERTVLTPEERRDLHRDLAALAEQRRRPPPDDVVVT